MSPARLRESARGACRWAMARGASAADWQGRSAIVFAPHPDDETLGCGGTIIKKVQVGAEVRIAVMTDGSRSHADLVEPSWLRAARATEAVAAGRALGAQEVLFLGLPDGQLSQHVDEGVREVCGILRRFRPQEVFVPCARQEPPDHVATHGIVRAALLACGAGVTVCEYPIWLWRHWPWTAAPAGVGRASFLGSSLVAGRCLLRDFGFRVDVADVLARKREALACHRSQVSRLGPRWPTLEEVSEGEFVACFFQDREIFRRYQLPARAGVTPTRGPQEA